MVIKSQKVSFSQYYDWAIFRRWFDEKVSSLDLSAPLSILPELSVEETIGIMNNEGYDQLPVIDATG